MWNQMFEQNVSVLQMNLSGDWRWELWKPRKPLKDNQQLRPERDRNYWSVSHFLYININIYIWNFAQSKSKYIFKSLRYF